MRFHEFLLNVNELQPGHRNSSLELGKITQDQGKQGKQELFLYMGSSL